MKKIIENKKAIDYVSITIGTIIMACSMNMFYEPNNLVTGGVTGLAIIIRHLSLLYFGWGVPLWLSNAVLNVPLFLIAVKFQGKEFITKTLFATVSLTIALYFTQTLPQVKDDLFIAAVFGGVMTGVGLGLVFRASATTGGTDLAASIVQKFFKHISISKILFVMDSVIIALGFVIFNPITAMYAVIVVFISTKVIGSILEGLSFAKAAFIISDMPEEIAAELHNQTERGVTALVGKGMYTGNDKNVLLCVLSQKQVVRLKEIVGIIDKNAFVIVADVREVLGLGFQSL